MSLIRLLQRKPDGEIVFREPTSGEVPAYAILSHTWGEEEVIYQDLKKGKDKSKTVNKAGWRKIQFCAKQAAVDGLEYFWVDTCCIDKKNAVELSAAINSMSRWYQNAARCYVYLTDVSQSDTGADDQRAWEEAFRKSRWFTRGWTLQELIAPIAVDFFSLEGNRLGNKLLLESTIHEITGIASNALRGDPLSNFSIKEQRSWAINNSRAAVEKSSVLPISFNAGSHDLEPPISNSDSSEENDGPLSMVWDGSSQSSLQEVEPVVAFAAILIRHTELPMMYEHIRQNFAFSKTRFVIYQLLKNFSTELSADASNSVEKAIGAFAIKRTLRISQEIEREIFGHRDRTIFDSLKKRQQLNALEKTEQYIKGLTQADTEATHIRQEKDSTDNWLDGDTDFDLPPNLELVRSFIIGSAAFENLCLCIHRLVGVPLAVSKISIMNSTDDTKPLEICSSPAIGLDKDISRLVSEKVDNRMCVMGDVRKITRVSTDVTEPVQRPNSNSTKSGHKVHIMTRLLYWPAIRILRPRPKARYRRLEWQCTCGKLLYGDFRGSDEHIEKLATDIEAIGISRTGDSTPSLAQAMPVTETINPQVLVAATETITSTSIRTIHREPLHSSTPQTGTSPADDTADITTQGIGSSTGGLTSHSNNSASRAARVTRRPRFVALCMSTGIFQKTYSEIDVSRFPQDSNIFYDFKAAYQSCVGSRAKSITSWAVKPIDIKFVQFLVDGSKRVYPFPGAQPDCTICAYTEHKEDLVSQRGYEPFLEPPALACPPIPREAFFHLWECPRNKPPALQAFWLSRLPKKLDEKIEKRCLRVPSDAEGTQGWGILIIEGPDPVRFTIVVIVTSLAAAVVYSAARDDVSSGFAIGGFIVACWAALLAALFVQWQNN